MALVVILLTACQKDDDKANSSANIVNIGDVVPEFTLSGTNGETVSSSSLKGQVYLLSFFDTGCSDCQKELPVIQQIYDKYKSLIPVLNVPRSQSAEQVKAYWDKEGLSMPIYTAYDKDLYYKFAVSGIPRIYIVNGEGKIHAVLTDNPLADYNSIDNILRELVSDKKVNVSFKVKVSAPTRGTSDFYFQNEHTISYLEIFFFDAETRKFATKLIINNPPRTDDQYYDTDDDTFLTQSLNLKVGIYNIFAVANYDYMLDDIETQDEFLGIVDAQTYQAGVEANIPDKGPVMTSRATALQAIDLIPYANKDYVLTIEMERVMAKLQIGVQKNLFELKHNNNKYADINITNYKLVNLMRQYYLFLHRDDVEELGPKPVFVMPDNFGDYIDEGDNYVVDPLFYEKTGNVTDAAKFKDFYASWFGDYTTDNFASMPAANNYGYAYVLENTSHKTSQKNGYSPGIIFKAAVSPAFVYMYDSKTHALIEETRPEYWPETIYLYNYNFYSSIMAVNVASGYELDVFGNYTDSQLKDYGIKQCKFNMGVYETYYIYWIQHRSYSIDPMGPMKYGIVRNNFYKMIVTGVNGIGHSSITPEIMRDNYPNSYVDVSVN